MNMICSLKHNAYDTYTCAWVHLAVIGFFCLIQAWGHCVYCMLECKCLYKVPDQSTILPMLHTQDWRKQSGWSDFGQTSSSFSQGKNESPFFHKKQVINRSVSVIFGHVRLSILSYNKYKKYMKRCKIISYPRIMLTK